MSFGFSDEKRVRAWRRQAYRTRASGLSNKRIAEQLYISAYTV